MSMDRVTAGLLRDSVWVEGADHQQAEARYYQVQTQMRSGSAPQGKAARTAGATSGLTDSIEATMSIIQKSLNAGPKTSQYSDLEQRVTDLENNLKRAVQAVEKRVAVIEQRLGITVSPTASAPAEPSKEEEEEEDFDPFASDNEEDEEERRKLKEERVKKYQQKKTKKPPVVAKSSLILEVKPWDTETDMKEVEQLVRSITTDGLVWGAAKLIPVAYGIMKLQISCVVEDEKVGTDFLEDSITGFEDHVQSVDVVAFNKI